MNFAPGTDYRYSNTDNIVLGILAEETSLVTPTARC